MVSSPPPKKYSRSLDDIRFMAFCISLSTISDLKFQYRNIWEATKELYKYTPEGATYQIINTSRMQSDIKRCVKEGYLTTSGNKGGFSYNKTEKLILETTKPHGV